MHLFFSNSESHSQKRILIIKIRKKILSIKNRKKQKRFGKKKNFCPSVEETPLIQQILSCNYKRLIGGGEHPNFFLLTPQNRRKTI